MVVGYWGRERKAYLFRGGLVGELESGKGGLQEEFPQFIHYMIITATKSYPPLSEEQERKWKYLSRLNDLPLKK